MSATIFWTRIAWELQGISSAILGLAPIVIKYAHNSQPPPSHGWDEVPRARIGNTDLTVVVGNILDQEVEAIVNAANEVLLGGGGIDGAIHQAAGGTKLKDYCAEFPVINQQGHRINTGEAVITPSFDIANRTPSIKHVIHTAGPRGGTANRAELLKNAYHNSLHVAKEKGIRSIAFPAISVGIFAYPFEEAQNIAYQTVKEFVVANPGAFDKISFVYFAASNGRQVSIERIWNNRMADEP